MYIISLERIPLPKLSTYVFFSIFSFVTSILYLLVDYVYDKYMNNLTFSTENITIIDQDIHNKKFIIILTEYCLYDTWCFWSFINLTYCGLIMIGKGFQQIFFGELRHAEQSHILDKFWNFVFYKLVFIYGILNVQSLYELLLWTGWSSILGFLHLLTNLTKDRFEFIVQSPDTSIQSHLKIASLLIIILIFGNALSCISIIVGVRFSYHLMFFMLAEVFQLSAITVYVLISYGIYFYTNGEDKILSSSQNIKFKSIIENQKSSQWPNKMVAQYYAELYYTTIANVVDFVHNLHMLLWNNIKINMTGLVIGMHLQYLYYDISKRYYRHKKYVNIVKFIEKYFPLINKGYEKCAICWESLMMCRMLPCNHFFHDACLRPWFEHSSLCPTCRILIKNISSNSIFTKEIMNSTINQMTSDKLSNQLADDDTNYASQISVVYPKETLLNSSTLMGKVNDIHSIYPNIPIETIYKELKIVNGNVDSVIDRIQKGRIMRPLPRVLTGPMQIELDLRQNDDYNNGSYAVNECKINSFKDIEQYNEFDVEKVNINNKIHRQCIFQIRKKDIFNRGLEKYKSKSIII